MLTTTFADELKLFNEKSKVLEKTGIDLYETKAIIPNITYMLNNPEMGGKRGSLPNLIIGQGETLVSPIQIIQFMNLIAMEGRGCAVSIASGSIMVEFLKGKLNLAYE